MTLTSLPKFCNSISATRDAEVLINAYYTLLKTPQMMSEGIAFGTLLEDHRYFVTHHEDKPEECPGFEVFKVNWQLSDPANSAGQVYGYVRGISSQNRLWRELTDIIRLHDRVPVHRLILGLSLRIPLFLADSSGSVVSLHEVHHGNCNSADNRIFNLFAAKSHPHRLAHEVIDQTRSSLVSLAHVVGTDTYLKILYRGELCSSGSVDHLCNKASIEKNDYVKCGCDVNQEGRVATRKYASLLNFGYPELLSRCMVDVLEYAHSCEGLTKTRAIESNLSANGYKKRTIETAITALCHMQMMERPTKGSYLATKWALEDPV